MVMLLLSTIISLISFSIMSHIYAFATLNPKLIFAFVFLLYESKSLIIISSDFSAF